MVLGKPRRVERDLIRTRAAESRSHAKAASLPSTCTAERGHQTPRAGPTLQQLAGNYDLSVSTMRRVTRAA